MVADPHALPTTEQNYLHVVVPPPVGTRAAPLATEMVPASRLSNDRIADLAVRMLPALTVGDLLGTLLQ
jgi:hypothetical protein